MIKKNRIFSSVPIKGLLLTDHRKIVGHQVTARIQ